MIEHTPWTRELMDGTIPSEIAVVGYSHYRKESDIDHDRFTLTVMENVLSGEQSGDAFFSAVPNYFGHADRTAFWRSVHFFNFVPEAFLDTQKFATATSKQNEFARSRFLRLLENLMPDKVFIFSRKAWRECPITVEEETGGACTSLICNPRDNWGTYTIKGKSIRVCGFRHPLFARTEQMRAAVHEFLDLK